MSVKRELTGNVSSVVMQAGALPAEVHRFSRMLKSRVKIRLQLTKGFRIQIGCSFHKRFLYMFLWTSGSSVQNYRQLFYCTYNNFQGKDNENNKKGASVKKCMELSRDQIKLFFQTNIHTGSIVNETF